MLRLFASAALFALLAVVAPAREMTLFRAGQEPDAKKTPARQDPRAIVDELRLELQSVVADLSKKDTGANTRAKQKNIVKLIDDLLDSDNDPPPPNGNPPPNAPPPDAPPPPDGENNPPMPKTPNAEPMQPKENVPAPMPNKSNPPEHKPQAKNQAPQAKNPAEPKFGQGERDRPAMSLEDMRKDMKNEPWNPRLPPRDLQDIDVYAKTRFMGRYEELLRAYYRTIAEESRRRESD